MFMDDWKNNCDKKAKKSDKKEILTNNQDKKYIIQ